MDTQKIVGAGRSSGVAVTLIYEPTADFGARWLACIGIDANAAGRPPDVAPEATMDREAQGPEPPPVPPNDLAVSPKCTHSVQRLSDEERRIVHL